jgi:hypothetical protein
MADQRRSVREIVNRKTELEIRTTEFESVRHFFAFEVPAPPRRVELRACDIQQQSVYMDVARRVSSQNIHCTFFIPRCPCAHPQQQASMSNLRLKILSVGIAE